LFRYIDLSSVDQDSKTISDAREVACGEAPSRARQLVLAGDVLVSTVRPNLNGVARVPSELEGATASTGFCVLRPEPKKLDGSYLFQWVKSPAFISDMVSKATGASYPAVSDRIIFESPIPLPPLQEQRRIAAILDQAETLRTQRRQALAHLDTLSQSLFLDMFGDPVANPQRFDVASLGDICDVRDGTHDSPKYVGEGYPLVTSKNLSSGQVDLSNVNFISAADYEAINRRSKVDRGDLLMPMIGTIGNPVLIDHEPRYAVKNVAIVKFPEGSPSNIFIRAILSGRYFDFVVAQRNRGGTQKFVSLGDLRSFPIPLPPPALQQTFATRIQAIEALKATHRTALAQLDALFASLQQRTFAGEL
jgi:type I restriction enzyme S subunit